MSKTESRTPTLPFDPLWDKAVSMSSINPFALTKFSNGDFAQMVGCDVKVAGRWQARGEIPWLAADRAAIEMGLHPFFVWGFDWFNVQGDFAEIASGAKDESIQRSLNKIVKDADGKWGKKPVKVKEPKTESVSV